MATSYSCEKCGKEKVVDLYDTEIFDYTKYIGQETVTISFQCKRCEVKNWILLSLKWNGNELIGWDIKRIVNVNEQRKIPVKVEAVKQPPPTAKKKGSNLRNGDERLKHIDNIAHSSNFKKDGSVMNDKIASLNSNEELGEERLLSAIWLGLVKLKINADDRANIMNKIESILEDINSPKKGDDF